MSNTALAVLEKEIRGSSVMEIISNSLGKEATDPKVKMFINGALMFIRSKVGQKGDVSNCISQSIIDCLIEAATKRLPVDNRHYACLVSFGTTCTLIPEWRGYVAKIKEADASAKVIAALVFKGDIFKSSQKDGFAFYEHVRLNPFLDDLKDMIGAYCFIKTDTGSTIEFMSRVELDKVRATSKAAFAYIWLAWPHEQYIKTVIRRGSKRAFNEAVAELDAMDNIRFYDRPPKEPVKIADTAPLPKERHIIEAEVVKDLEPTDDELNAKADEAKARLHADTGQEPKTEAKAPPAKPQAPSNGKLRASGIIVAEHPANAGGYKTYEITGELQPGTDWLKRFATKDEIIIEIMTGYLESSTAVTLEYTEVPWSKGGKSGINYAIDRIIELGDAQE